MASKHFGTAVGPIFLDYLFCTGIEETLINCSFTGPVDCFHTTDDVGIKCYGKQRPDLILISAIVFTTIS